jgi:hypothetical protein
LVLAAKAHKRSKHGRRRQRASRSKWKPKEASSEAEPSVEAQGSAEAKSSVEVALRNTYGDVVVDINEKRSDLELGAS